MPAPRLNMAVARRREQVAQLYLQGWTQTQIAQRLGVSQGTISTDLKALQKEWRASAVRDFDLAREVELKKLEQLEREASEGYERSQKAAQEVRIQGEPPHQKTEKRVKNQYGDPRFLEVRLKCSIGRRALLGLDAPTKIAPTTPDGQPLTFQQRQVLIETIVIEQFGPAAIHNSERKEKET